VAVAQVAAPVSKLVRALGAIFASGLLTSTGCTSDGEKTSGTGGAANATGGAIAMGGTNVAGGGVATGGFDPTGGTTAEGGESGTSMGGVSGGSAAGGAGNPPGGSAGSGSTGSGGSATAGSGGGPAGTLALYFIDTEGGQATVMRLPDGQVFIVDTGNPGARDGDRIQAVLRDELGRTSVDYLLTTHYHADHVGGATYLHDRTPVRNFLDHGDEEAPSSYLAIANAATRRVIEAGDTLDTGGVHFDFVCSAGALVTAPFPGGAANSYCSGVAQKGESDENENSVGFILRFGSFDFVDLGDLLWDWELRLACPTNLLGTVDLYLTTHHGLTRSGAPPLVRALEPLAAIMNNGPRKGGGGSTWTTLAQAPGAMNVWQLHQALAAPAAENAPAEQIANLTEGASDAAYFLEITVTPTGAFTIRNPRTSVSRTYQSR
jgi:beta-lactamase superfamily II metal-dependent hydrolase